jgi:hypothetical protein
MHPVDGSSPLKWINPSHREDQSQCRIASEFKGSGAAETSSKSFPSKILITVMTFSK